MIYINYLINFNLLFIYFGKYYYYFIIKYLFILFFFRNINIII